MNAIKTYGNYIKKYAEPHPAVSRKMIDIGLHLEQFRTEHFAAKEMPEAYRKLNTLGVKNTLSALEHPDQTVWSNLFAPVEIFQCFGLNALSMECLSSFLSGFTCEDYFIDRAEQKGDRLHALLLPQKFHRCRRLRRHSACRFWRHNFHDL